MRSQLSKWGNSLAVRLPKAFVDKLGVGEGEPVDIDIAGDVITLRRPKQSLEHLLEQVSADNLHGETDTGKPVGREQW
ncbi:MAG: AbrB/MazE/SpoVT family DNA-binding domain-containing protein [Rhodospirillales bacterium]|nr:AbrB/MazE/SpoVT family DNA-binding domain-containing protein [Rhodospirillales bacterium]